MNAVLRNDALNARISGDLFQLPAGMASFAVGASMADENLAINPSAAYQSGDVSGYGGAQLPLSASRNSSAVFAETIIPIVKHLEADLAVRHDRYPNATRHQPEGQLPLPADLAAAAARAPTARASASRRCLSCDTSRPSAPAPTFTDPVTGQTGQFNQTYGGNPNLQPEKSEQSSLGFVVDPVKGLSIAVDWWKINVNNLVTTLAPRSSSARRPPATRPTPAW